MTKVSTDIFVLLPGAEDLIQRRESGEPSDELLLRIVRGVEASLEGVRSSVMLVNPNGKTLRAAVGPSLPRLYNESVDNLEIGPGIGCCGQAAFTKKRVVVADVMTHPNWRPFTELAELANIRSTTSEPILSKDGRRCLGTLAAYRSKPGAPSVRDIAILERAAQLAAGVLDP